jgi:hypothetical protein
MFGVRLVFPCVHRRTAVPVVLPAAGVLIGTADRGIERDSRRSFEGRAHVPDGLFTSVAYSP